MALRLINSVIRQGACQLPTAEGVGCPSLLCYGHAYLGVEPEAPTPVYLGPILNLLLVVV